MSFLQPWMLAALPLIALPIVIHLINRRRFQTMRWAAMIFLLAANRMSRGFARIRQWLILAMRTAAVAGLVFMLARPLSSGWLGLAAGSATDTTLILLDRSPSMWQRRAGDGATKLQAGRRQLADALAKLHANHWILIESAGSAPIELTSPADLLISPATEPAAGSADLPELLRAAYDYVKQNQTGRTDVWICSDLRRHDWDNESGRWGALRESFQQLPQQVRFFLLADPDTASDNVALRVEKVRRRENEGGAVLHLSLRLVREDSVAESRDLSIAFDIGGARSVLPVTMHGSELELTDHSIPLDSRAQQGWGRVSIPADANLGDNEYYFVYGAEPVRRTVLVSDEPSPDRAIELAAAITPDPAIPADVKLYRTSQVASIPWDSTSLVLWHAQLPQGEAATALRGFVERDGQVICFPPASPNGNTWHGMSWGAWQTLATPRAPASWRGDAGLLSNAQSGAPLPVGALTVRRYCELRGDVTDLATLDGGDTLLGHVPTPHGGLYGLATTADAADSSLGRDGVVLYVAIQRALAAGAARQGTTRHIDAGHDGGDSSDWKRLAGAEMAMSNQYYHHAGVFQHDDRLVAINRSAEEDDQTTLNEDQTDSLFAGLDFVRLDGTGTHSDSLVQEIWRLFVLLMLAAMVAEAWLCLPNRTAAAKEGVR